MTTENNAGRMIDPDEGRHIPADAPLARPLRQIVAGEWLRLILGIATVVFHLYLVFAGLVPSLVARPLHFMLAVPWIFFLLRARTSVERWGGYLLGGASLLSAGYVALNHEALVDQYGSLEGPLQMAMAVVLLAAVLEMARRSVKAILPSIASIVLAYGFFGH
ncbi:MAG: hypothetical protein JXQ84_00270 [Rhodospirillaceae bacterium]|nr:hypothetical protein [Rhodospirillaceae bacterium]